MKSKIAFYLFLSCLITIAANFAEVFAGTPGTIKWKYPVDIASCYSPAIGLDNTTYVPSGNRLLAINPDETLKWTFEVECSVPNVGCYVNTPSIDSYGNIYFQAQPDGVYAVDKGGSLIWKYNPSSGTSWPGGDCVGQIAIGQDGTVYASHGGGSLHAIDATTGQGKWISYMAGSPPAIATDGTLYSIGPSSAPYYLFALNKADGAVIMQSSVAIPNYSWPPILASTGDIYVIGRNVLYAYSSDGTKKWEYAHGGNVFSRPVTGVDGTVYIYSILAADRGYSYTLHAVNPDGSQKWTWESNRLDPGNLAVGDDGTIYLTPYGVTALNSEGALLWQTGFPVGAIYTQSWHSPVIGNDGTLYIIGTDTQDNKPYLFAFNISSNGPASSSWPMMGANAQHTHSLEQVTPPPPLEGNLSVSPASKDFEKLAEGLCSTPQQFTLSNTGNANLSIYSINLSDSSNYFLEETGNIFTDCPLNSLFGTIIPPAGSCNFSVKFCPQSVGLHNEYLTIASSDPDASGYVPLSGVGVSNEIIISTISGLTDGGGVVNGMWTGQPDSMPTKYKKEPEKYNHYVGYYVIESQNNNYYWEINGAGFGEYGQVTFSNPAISAFILPDKWSDTKIRIIPIVPYSFEADSSVDITITNAYGASGSKKIPAIGIIQSRGYGQCTWYVAKTLLDQNKCIPPSAYYTNGTINSNYEPKQWDALTFGKSHVAIIILPVPPPTITVSGKNTLYSYYFTVGEMNADPAWGEQASTYPPPGSTSPQFVVSVDSKGNKTVKINNMSAIKKAATGYYRTNNCAP